MILIGKFTTSSDLSPFVLTVGSDGVWDAEEVEAIYGVHHIYSQKKSKVTVVTHSFACPVLIHRLQDEEEHQQKADLIVDTVFKAIDKNNDGKITLAEFEAAGLAALPNFDSLGAEGHHYDVESGACQVPLPPHLSDSFYRQSSSFITKVRMVSRGCKVLRRFMTPTSEQFHNTAETQTDESYNHPEDIEHFAQHDTIERKEAEREAKFQGITVEEALAQHEEPVVSDKHPAEHPTTEGQEIPKKYERQVPLDQQDPAIRFRQAKAESDAHGEWGSGEGGYKPPQSPSEKMRKNLPYKVTLLCVCTELLVRLTGTHSVQVS
jgi:hypothetical protein